MGMISNFLRVDSNMLESFRADSRLLENRIYSDEIDDDPDFIDIDKSWDGIIFLLTGQNVEKAEGEMLKLFFSGNLIDPEQNLGYGPAHYLDATEVRYLSDKMNKIQLEELKGKFDAIKMKNMDVYPGIWDEGEVALSYLIDSFEDLRSFYQQAATNNQAIISILN